MAAQQHISEVVLKIAREEAPHALFLQLESALVRLSSDEPLVRKAAAQEIKELCHARVLGDLVVRGVSWQEWLNLLVKLRRYAARKAR